MSNIFNNLFSLGLPKDILNSPSLIVEGNKVIKEIPYPGILIEKHEKSQGLFINITVLENIKL